MQTIELISQIILLKIVGNGIPTQLTENVINYDDKRSYVFCRAMQDNNKNRLYVHEVFVADNLQNKGNTLQTAAFQPHGGIALYKSILANVLDAANVDITPAWQRKSPLPAKPMERATPCAATTANPVRWTRVRQSSMSRC